jgi:hypothetical protein
MPLLLTSLFAPQGGFPTPTTPPVFEIVGEPNASGTCGATPHRIGSQEPLSVKQLTC